MNVFRRTRFFSSIFMIMMAAYGLVLAGCGKGGDPGGGDNAATYTLTYNGNGDTAGTVPAGPASYGKGQTITVAGNTGNLVKTGCKFAGWNTEPDGSGITYAQGQAFTMGMESVTLYAKWTSDPTYTLAYDGNGNTGGSVPAGPANYEQGQAITVPGNPGNLVNTGYSFSGWNTAADGSGTTCTQGQTFTMGQANVTLYAVWTSEATYTVAYDGNGNTGGAVPADTTHYLQGQNVTVAGNTGNLVNTGYSFAGWNTRPDGSGTAYTQGQVFTMGSANMTLYARWVVPVYNVIYNANGSTGGSPPVAPVNYQQGQSATVLGNTGNLVKAGYSFSGWNTAADGSGTTYTQGQTFTMDSADVALYAIWTASPTYSVTYSGNGNTGGSAPVDATHYEQGQTVTVAGNPGGLVNTGYIFAGWNTRPDGGGTTCAQGQTFSMGPANVTLYAKWASSLFEYAYVTNEGDGTVSEYTIVSGGALVPMTPEAVAAGGDPWSVTVDPSHRHAYVTNEGDGTVSEYMIVSGGALAPMSPAAVPAGTGPQSIAIDPSGRYAYVADADSTKMSQYTVGAGGVLQPMRPDTVSAINEPESVVVDPSGKYVYSANEGDSTIVQYTIDANGMLTPMNPWWVRPVQDGTMQNGSISVIVDPSGRYVYAADYGGNTVSQFTIGAGGTLSPMTPAMVPAGLQPISVTVDPSGRYLYVANHGDNTVSGYTIGAGGTLTPMAPATAGTGPKPWSVTVDPSGRYVYVVNRGDNTVSGYTIGAGGTLTPMTPATVNTGRYPMSIITTTR